MGYTIRNYHWYNRYAVLMDILTYRIEYNVVSGGFRNT